MEGRKQYCCHCRYYREDGVHRTCAFDNLPIKEWYTRACGQYDPDGIYEEIDGDWIDPWEEIS